MAAWWPYTYGCTVQPLFTIGDFARLPERLQELMERAHVFHVLAHMAGAVQPEFFDAAASAVVSDAFTAAAKKLGHTAGIRCSIITYDTLEEVWFTSLPDSPDMLGSIVISKANSFKQDPKSLSPNPGTCSLMCCYMVPWCCCCSGTMGVQGSVEFMFEGEPPPGTKYILVVSCSSFVTNFLKIASP